MCVYGFVKKLIENKKECKPDKQNEADFFFISGANAVLGSFFNFDSSTNSLNAQHHLDSLSFGCSVEITHILL